MAELEVLQEMYHTLTARTPGRTAAACSLRPPIEAAPAAERREGAVTAAPLPAAWMLMSAILKWGAETFAVFGEELYRPTIISTVLIQGQYHL